MIRARIAFEREIASRGLLAPVAWGLVVVTIFADPRWRDGWTMFAACVLPFLLFIAAMRVGSGADSWFRSLDGSPLADTLGRTLAHLAILGVPLAVHTSLAADVLRYAALSVRFYALFVVVLYASLLAGRALFPSLDAIVGLSAVGVVVPLSGLLGHLWVGAWSPQGGWLVRLAVLALPLTALAVRWEVLGTWGVQIGRTRAWLRGVAALAVAVASLTLLEAVEDGPLEATSCDTEPGPGAVCIDWTADRAWMVVDGEVRLLPDREVRRARLGPNGLYVAEVGPYDAPRAVLHTPRGGIVSLPTVHDWAGFSQDGRWAARTEQGIAIVDLDGAMVRTGARDGAWLGEDLIVRRGFRFELWRADGTVLGLADTVPAFTDPALIDDSWLLEGGGYGRVQLRTQARAWRQVGFVASDLEGKRALADWGALGSCDPSTSVRRLSALARESRTSFRRVDCDASWSGSAGSAMGGSYAVLPNSVGSG